MNDQTINATGTPEIVTAVSSTFQVAKFNLADIEARDTAWLEVQNIRDDGPLIINGAPVRIEIRSPGTKEAMAAQHKIDTAATTRTFAAMRGKASKETVDDKIKQNADKLVAVTARIENFPIGAHELYSNPKLGYITEQVTKFHGDWANF